MLVWVKEYINKNFVTCKSLSNLQELYTSSKEKHPNVNAGFSEFCTFRHKWCVLIGWLAQKWHSLCVFKMLCCWSVQWTTAWNTKTWSKRSFATLRATNAWCIGVNLVFALHFWRNFLIRTSNMKMMRNLITVSGTLRIEQHWQLLQPLTKNTKRLWLMLLMI